MKKLAILATAAILGCAVANALPAKRGYHTYTQPDGTTVTVSAVGDEHGHYFIDREGTAMMLDNDGYIRPATSARIESLRSRAKTRRTEQAAKRVQTLSRAGSSTGSVYHGLGHFSDDFPRLGKVKILVFLVEYTDVKFKTPNPQDYFSRQLNATGFSEDGATGSAYDYFTEQSGGAFDPEFVVLGPVKLAHNMAYYGANDYWGDDLRPEEMVIEAVKAMDSQIDYSEFDFNNDGKIDNVFVIYAGYGEADNSSSMPNTVWPHNFEIRNGGTYDGKRLYGYTCSNEIAAGGKVNGIGTFCHEFSHVLGLPDLYNTEDEYDYTTPSDFDVMDYGPYLNDGRTPPNYSSVERNAMGWTFPKEFDGPANYTLEALSRGGEGYIIPTHRDNEFFMVENRQQDGWDKYLPGHGLLIWHVYFNQSVWDGNNPSGATPVGIDLVEAGGTADYMNLKTMATYPFPGTSGNTSFTPTSSPAMKTWDGTPVNYPITAITENGRTVSFEVLDFTNRAPKAVSGNGTSSSATLTWEAMPGAESYAVTVESGSEGGSTESTPHEFGSNNKLSLPEGWKWSGSTSDIYKSTSTNLTGKSAPSLKFAKDGYTLTSEVYSMAITNVSFWLAGANASNSSSFELQARTDENAGWATVYTVTNLLQYNNDGKTLSTEIPDGMHQIRFVYHKSSGNVALDDVTVTTSSRSFSKIIDRREVGNVQSCTVGVPADATLLRFYVEGIDAKGRYSLPSNTVMIDMVSGIESIATNDSLTTDGLTLTYTGQPGSTVTVYTITGIKVSGTITDAAGTARIDMPSAGLYIVVTPSGTHKVIIR